MGTPSDLIAPLGVVVALAGAVLIFAISGTVGIPVAAVGVAIVAIGLIVGRRQTGTSRPTHG